MLGVKFVLFNYGFFKDSALADGKTLTLPYRLFMQTLKLISLFLAYTLGIVTLALQIVCYRRKLEYRETIGFSLSLLLLILSVTVANLWPPQEGQETGLPELFSFLMTVVFAVMVPVNIHQERIHTNRRKKNAVVAIGGLFVMLLCGLLYFYYGILPVIYACAAFLYLTVFYSMFFILFTRPDSLIRFREKQERTTAILVLVSMVASLLLFLFSEKDSVTELVRRYDGFSLALITIILTLGKIPEDFKKLTQEETINEIVRDQLDGSGISRREREVLPLLVSGKTYREIADSLYISLPTVKTHVSSIYSKLEVRNRLELSNRIKKLNI